MIVKFVFDMRYAFMVTMGAFQIKMSHLTKFISLEDCDAKWKDCLETKDAESGSPGRVRQLQLMPSGVLELASKG